MGSRDPGLVLRRGAVCVALLLACAIALATPNHGTPGTSGPGSHADGKLCLALGGLACVLGAMALLGGGPRVNRATRLVRAARVATPHAVTRSFRARDWRSPVSLCRLLA